MKLYYSTCTCATVVHIAMEEAGARYERVEMSWQRDLNVAEVERLNPLGAVPVLVTDQGQVLTQSVAILEHIADTHPKARLLAEPGSLERAQILEWTTFCAADLLRAYAPLVRAEDMADTEAGQEKLRAFARENIHRYLEHAERGLTGKTYLVGERFTIADAYLFFTASLARWLEVPTERYAKLTAYLARIAQRPATRRILQLEELLD